MIRRTRIRRRSVAAALVLFLPTLPIPAQTIVVTGVREPLAVERLAADVVVIEGDALRDTGADSLADVLRREAGLQLSRNGGPGQSTGLFVRGAFSQQTVVLVDGVRVGSATLGFAALENLPIAQVDRIEVLRGPGSSVYGADAVGGVVQVFTRRGEPGLQLEAQADAGGYGSRDASLALRGAAGAWDGAATLAGEHSAGVSVLRPGDQFGNFNPDRDGYTLASAQAQLGFTPVRGQRFGLTLLRTRLESHYDASEYPPPSYAQDNTPDFRTKTATEVSAIDWRGRLTDELSGSARLSRSVDRADSGGHQIDRYRTTREQAEAQLAWRIGAPGQLVAALEHRHETASATAYGTDAARRVTAGVLALTGQAGSWSWQLDARHDDSSDFGGVDTARAGGAWAFAPGWKLRALVGSTFRAPSFNDLYYPGYGVPTVRPERGRSAEFGIGWHAADAEASLTAFRNRVRDLVGYESDRSLCPSDPSYDFGCARNVARATLAGATLAGRRRLGAWTLKAQLDLLDAHDDATGQRLPRRAAHQATLGAEWAADGWRASASVLQVGARPDAGVVLPQQTTLDLVASRRLGGGWSLQGKLLDVTNVDTQPARDYQAPRRQAWIGLRYEGGV